MNIRSRLQRLTFFDKLIIAVAVLGIVFFVYIFFRKTTYLTVTIKVGQDSVTYQNPGVKAWFGQLFSIGMTEKDGLGSTRAEVLKIYSFDSEPQYKAVYLTTKLKVVYNRASNQYTYKGYPVLVGSTLRLYLDRLLVDGMVTNVEGMRDPRRSVKLLVKAQLREETPVFPETSGTKAYVADALHMGDEVKDDQGNVVIKIIDKTTENAKKIVSDNGRLLALPDPLKKDVYLTLQIDATVTNGKYYVFDDIPVLIGWGIPIHTSFVSVWPEATEITEQKTIN